MSAEEVTNTTPQAEEVEEEESVSMVDVLNQEKEEEEDCAAVLGGSDCGNCTYPQGPLPRQAVYACLTCVPTQAAGVCLACSLDCHDGHDLCELYTKRNFSCDCGNKKFPNPCKLFPNKSEFNESNSYNQNFRGVYCTCSRPYPDPEDHVEDEMIQCIICEDWFHGRHLGMESQQLPKSEDYGEMVCTACLQRHSFLWQYQGPQLRRLQEEGETSKENTSTPDKGSDLGDKVVVEGGIKGTREPEVKVGEAQSESKINEVKVGDETDSQSKSKVNSVGESRESQSDLQNQGTNENTPLSDSERLKERLKQDCVITKVCEGVPNHALFLPVGWRSGLCRCGNCLSLYTEQGLDFLLSDVDSIAVYESRGKAAQMSSHDQGMQALAQMDRVQQVEVLHGFNDLKSHLKDYLQKFAANGKVVREEDIREFFSQMESRKKQRTNAMPSFTCH